MRRAGRVARIGERRGVYRVLVRKPRGKSHLEEPHVEGRMNWIDLAQKRDKCRALVNAVMKLQVP